MSAESDLKRYRDEAGKLRLAISKASLDVAAKRKKATTASGAASRSKSATTIRTKLAEAERAENDAIAAEKKRGDLEGKLAATEVKVTTTQTRYEKEQQASQKKALDAIRRQTPQRPRSLIRPGVSVTQDRIMLRSAGTPVRRPWSPSMTSFSSTQARTRNWQLSR